jgi:hypothetical protein
LDVGAEHLPLHVCLPLPISHAEEGSLGPPQISSLDLEPSETGARLFRWSIAAGGLISLMEEERDERIRSERSEEKREDVQRADVAVTPCPSHAGGRSIGCFPSDFSATCGRDFDLPSAGLRASCAMNESSRSAVFWSSARLRAPWFKPMLSAFRPMRTAMLAQHDDVADAMRVCACVHCSTPRKSSTPQAVSSM